MGPNVRVRFAPSPTGYLHVGGARSALFNFLFAKRHNGTFILRIEDTDRSRFVESALQEIYESLKWLGLQWDEGPVVGGNFGPYIQSERLHLYKKYADQLLESGHAYRCFCTPERLTALREEQEKKKEPSGYDKHCRNLSNDEIQENLEKNLPFVIRFKIPSQRKVIFNDLIRGEITYDSSILDDLVLIKTDGFPTYHMANVVDDHLMEITHVLRGDEWIASTPRHVLIYEAFGWQMPHFAHLPVILSPDGGKLSKRKGAASVMDYKQAGFLPEALFNFLALLGWAPGDDREKMSLQEMIDSFDLTKVSPKSAVLDEKKLEWMNGSYLAERSSDSLAQECIKIWKEKQWVSENQSQSEYIIKVIDLLKSRSRKIPELAESASYFFVDPVTYEEKAAKKYFVKETVSLLSKIKESISGVTDFSHNALEQSFRTLAESLQIGFGQLIHPTRLAVSGISFGPGLFEMLELLGAEKILKRIDRAIDYIEKGM